MKVIATEMPIFDLNLDKLEEEPETVYMEDSGYRSLPVSGPFSGSLPEIEITSILHQDLTNKGQAGTKRT